MNQPDAQVNAILQKRLGGVTIDVYAENLAERERFLEDGKISKGWFGGVKGDTEWVMSMLEGYARRYKVPHVPGDFDRSNRVAEWDQLVQSDPAARAAWCEVYGRALVKMNGVYVDSPEGSAHVERVKQDADLMMNPFLSIAKRKRGISLAIKAQRDAGHTAAFQQAAATPAIVDEDPVLFPGERLSKLSDFIRLQKAAQSGDFMGALAREGIDPGYYGQMSIKYANAMQSDPMLAMRHAKMLMR